MVPPLYSATPPLMVTRSPGVDQFNALISPRMRSAISNAALAVADGRITRNSSPP